MSTPDDVIGPAVENFYDRWLGEMAAADPHVAMGLPTFEQLDREQVTAWMHAYAAAVSVAAHMATALLLTMDG